MVAFPISDTFKFLVLNGFRQTWKWYRHGQNFSSNPHWVFFAAFSHNVIRLVLKSFAFLWRCMSRISETTALINRRVVSNSTWPFYSVGKWLSTPTVMGNYKPSEQVSTFWRRKSSLRLCQESNSCSQTHTEMFDLFRRWKRLQILTQWCRIYIKTNLQFRTKQ